MKKYLIKFNNSEYLIEAEELKNRETRRKKFSTSNMCIPPPSLIKGELKREGDIIYAPMNGIVIDVRVKKRKKVNKGDILLILETMKMESEIVASISGTIKSVSVKKGQSVYPGDVLVEIKSS